MPLTKQGLGDLEVVLYSLWTIELLAIGEMLAERSEAEARRAVELRRKLDELDRQTLAAVEKGKT